MAPPSHRHRMTQGTTRAHARATPALRAAEKIQNSFPPLAIKSRVSSKPVAPIAAIRAARGIRVEGVDDLHRHDQSLCPSVLAVAEQQKFPRALTRRAHPHDSCLHVSRLPPTPPDPPGTFRDLFGTPFGPGFLSSSCPMWCATPIPAAPSECPVPSAKTFAHPRLSAPFHRPANLRNEPTAPNSHEPTHDYAARRGS